MSCMILTKGEIASNTIKNKEGKKEISGVLSDREITEEVKKVRGSVFIKPFNASQLANSSYDVRLGQYYYEENTTSNLKYYNPWSAGHRGRYWSELKEAKKIKDATEAQEMDVKVGDRVIIVQPRSTILGHTQEFIGGRGDITTHMQARSGIGRSCVTVCKCAGWGDIGWCLPWTMEIENTGKLPVVLIVGERVAQIVFHRTGEPLRQYNDGGSYQKVDPYDEETLMKAWKPQDMLSKLKRDT